MAHRTGMIEIKIHFPGSSGLGHGSVWMPCCPRIGEHLSTRKRGEDLLFIVVDVTHAITVDDWSLGHSGGIPPIVTLADAPKKRTTRRSKTRTAIVEDDNDEAELNR